MAKETNDVKNYKTFELVRIVYTDRETDASVLVEHSPIALFDDRELVLSYIADAGYFVSENPSAVPNHVPEGVHVFVREEWTETEPTAETTNLPFNPTYEAPKEPVAVEATEEVPAPAAE